MNPFTLEGKRILVTGASSGIGRACARMAAEGGATLVVTGRNEAALAETKAALVRPEEHLSVAGDLADPAFAQRLVEAAGPFDGFVHSAGVCEAIPAAMVSEEAIRASLEVNYAAFIRLMKFFSKRKFVREGFSAVAISSVSASAGWPGGTLYAGSKGALSAAVRSLAVELAPKRIRVNAVSPSNIRTPLLGGLVALNDEESLATLVVRQPLGLGTPEQVAAPVCFLLSDAASFITGVDLPVDGGYLAQ